MSDDLLLMFAYHFPPENVIGAARPYRFSKYLPRLGVRTHTITAADLATRPDLDAETVPDPFVTHARQGLGWQVERVIRRFLMPGATGSQWASKAYQAGCRFIDAENGARPIILSTYPPIGTAFAGYWLAKKRRLPWILDLRDPIGAGQIAMDENLLCKHTARLLEQVFISAADCVIANTDAAQARLQQQYPEKAEKITLLWNGFDPENRLTALPVANRERRIYSHVGELYEGRVITPLLLAMDRLIKSGRLQDAEVAIQLVGPIRSTSVPTPEFITAAQDAGWLQIIPEQVPQLEAQQIMRESSGLLLIHPSSALQVPAKLFEYVQIGRPVLAYLLPDTPAEWILKQSNTPCVYAYSNQSVEDLEDALLKFFQMDSESVAPSAWFEHEFNTQRHAEHLLQLMHELKASPSADVSMSAKVY